IHRSSFVPRRSKRLKQAMINPQPIGESEGCAEPKSKSDRPSSTDTFKSQRAVEPQDSSILVQDIDTSSTAVPGATAAATASFSTLRSTR
ncbi:unnamed protein product, partial [Mycena citricolor]